jgi:hypothetical protein
MPRRTTLALLIAAALATPAGAGAASFVAGAPLRPSTRADLSCLFASPDGGLVAWQDRRRTIRAGTLRDAARAATLGSAPNCPAAATGAGGGAALAAQAGSGLQLALQPAGGGSFAPFALSALPAGVVADGSGLALGGGVVAMGASRQDGDRTVPVLLLRALDGSWRSVPLPGGADRATTSEDLVGPLAALDAAGRGLVVWGATRAAGGRLLAAPFDGAGALGPAQVLAARGVDDTFATPSLAAGADGAVALGWVSGRRTRVATGTTRGGLDPAGAASTPVHWVVAVEPDGAAVAVDAAYNGERGRVRIATRAAGRPFSAARAYPARDVGDQQPALAVDHGGFLAAFAARPTIGSTELGLLQAVTGRTGARPGHAVTVPIASAEVSEVAAALPPGGRPAVLATTQRSTDCVGCRSLRERAEIDAFFYSRRPPQRPRGVRVRIAPAQRLGRPQAVRVRVTCARGCAVRVAGAVAAAGGEFDTSRALPRGTSVLRVPYSSGGGSAPFEPLRRARRVRLGIAVDDRRGELRLLRTVVVRP